MLAILSNKKQVYEIIKPYITHKRLDKKNATKNYVKKKNDKYCE